MKKLIQVNLLVLLLLSSASAFAVALNDGTYRLLDHPDAALTDLQGPYGLRMDSLTPPDGAGPTFSVNTNGALVLLVLDGDTATISGRIWNNATSSLWEVSQTYEGLTPVAGPEAGVFTTDESAASQIVLTDPGNILHTFLPKSDGSASMRMIADGHRCDEPTTSGGSCIDGLDTIVMRGWFDLDPHDGTTNDWLVQAQLVPLPAAVWLFISGLGMLVGVARRRT